LHPELSSLGLLGVDKSDFQVIGGFKWGDFEIYLLIVRILEKNKEKVAKKIGG